MNLDNILALARKHLNGESARLCLADAVAMKDAGLLGHAEQRALRSLQHSVGVFHPDFQRAKVGHS